MSYVDDIVTAEEREKLYNEVWSEPVITVAKRYNISDNGLRKRCKKLYTACPLCIALAAVACTAVAVFITAAFFSFFAFVFRPDRAFIGTVDIFCDGYLLSVDFNKALLIFHGWLLSFLKEPDNPAILPLKTERA